MFTLTWTYSCLQTLRQFAAFWVVSTPNMYLVVPPGPYHLKKTEPAANMDLLIFRWHFSCKTNVDTVVQKNQNKRRYCQDQRFLDILACWKESRATLHQHKPGKTILNWAFEKCWRIQNGFGGFNRGMTNSLVVKMNHLSKDLVKKQASTSWWRKKYHLV